jgi:uncharacterized RDD family membrane protein YckC
MADQYFVADARRRGPLSWQAVWDLARIGEIGADTPILLPNASSWQPARAIEHLGELFSDAPLPAEATDDLSGDRVLAITSPELAGPFTRLLARVIDYAILCPLSMILIMKAPSGQNLIKLDMSGSWLIYRRVFYAFIGQIALIWLIVQLSLSLCMAFAGTSLGKAMLGIRVQNLQGENTLRFHLERELKIWVLVLCVGFYVAALFQIGRQYVLLRFGQPTVYDRNFAVVECEASFRRFVMGLCALLLLSAAAIGVLEAAGGSVGP